MKTQTIYPNQRHLNQILRLLFLYFPPHMKIIHRQSRSRSLIETANPLQMNQNRYLSLVSLLPLISNLSLIASFELFLGLLHSQMM